MLARFFYMGGYAVYVWLAYGTFAIVFLANIIWACRQNQRAWRHLLRLQNKPRI
jgi:heme exporter protein D